jgi:surface antigen
MNEQDRAQAGLALETTPIRQVSTWENPDTGHSYSITPTRTYQQDSQPCRDYTTEAVIDGQKETVSGTACRQPDGTW